MSCYIKSHVKDVTSILDFQLVSYSSIGRASLELKDFDDQKIKEKQFEIKNGVGNVIGVLQLKVQYLFSTKKIYADELKETQIKLKDADNKVKVCLGNIDKMYLVFPGEAKPDLNFHNLLSNRNSIMQKTQTSDNSAKIVILMLCSILAGINLVYSIAEPSLVELSAILIFMIQILKNKEHDHPFLSNLIIVLLCIKDFLYMFLFTVTDHTDLLKKLDGGELILNIIRYMHIAGIALKIGLFVTLTISKKANDSIQK